MSQHPSELISAYLDGELTFEEQVRLQDHLASCGRCAADLETMQTVRTAIRSLPVLDLPAGVMPTSDGVVVPMRRQRGLWVGVAAAVIVAVITIAALVTPGRASVSIDELNSHYGARASYEPASGLKVFPPDFVDAG